MQVWATRNCCPWRMRRTVCRQVRCRGPGISTISRRLAAITARHKAAGIPLSPASTRHSVIGEGLNWPRRARAIAYVQKTPLDTLGLVKVIDVCPKTALGIRDKALRLIAFVSSCGRSELVQIDHESLRWSASVTTCALGARKNSRRNRAELSPVRTVSARNLRRSGTGKLVGRRDNLLWTGVPASRSARKWVASAPLGGQHIYHPSRGSYALRQQMDGYASHSFRAGLITTCHRNRISEPDLARRSGRRSVAVLRQYIREKGRFSNNPAAALGL